ncbi:hypothetical protein C3486_12905 [Streptomyces sp. Ru73]|uniref:CGNR zinc finger domain-containing protein n=1 Tax=Streptomyces sp. Ru73 TaxID=2080748 RepID=UPI000CDDECFA|nr:CGNR zinc finger domain-containing protein [Streptomyces sp. Ru73]POX40690.1 hypothetical protein C3486_12905 [Streptomyces sp. Ru73]
MGAEEGRGFRPAHRLLELANAVREDPDLPRAELAALLARHGESAEDLSEEAFSEGDAEELRGAVGRLIDILAASPNDDGSDGDAGADRAALAINALLEECGARPRLSRHGGHVWHLHVDRGDDASWAEWFTATSALALAQIFSEHGRPAWGECTAVGCRRLYLSTGPGSPRRFCSTACATRTRVAAHRRRKKAEKGGGARTLNGPGPLRP